MGMATDTAGASIPGFPPAAGPAYREVLGLLRNLNALKANLVRGVVPCLQLEPATVQARLDRGQPLLSGETLAIPGEFLRAALSQLSSQLPKESRSRSVLDQLLVADH